jgi:CRP-like cAMP-binding protein
LQDLGGEGEYQADKEDNEDDGRGDDVIEDGSTEVAMNPFISPPIPRDPSFYPQHLPPFDEDKDNHDDFGCPSTNDFAVSPSSWFYKQWARLVFGSILWLALRAPLLLAFKRLDSTSNFDFTQETNHNTLRAIHILDCVLEFVLLADVALHFEFLGYFDKKLMTFVSEHGLIRWNYMTTWMCMDVIGSIPWENFAGSLSPGCQWLRVLKLINCLRFPKLGLRVSDTKQSGRFDSPGDIHIHARLRRTGRLLEIAFSFGFTLHLLICIYWALVQYEWEREQEQDQDHDGDSDLYASASFKKWLPPEKKFDVTKSTFADQYIFAAHSVLLCMIGNDLQPHTIPENIFSSFLMLLGVVSVAGVIGSMTQILTRADLLENEKNDKIESVMTFLYGRSVPLLLQNKICAYLNYIWGTGQSTYHQSLVNELPDLLSLQLKIALKQNLIEVLPMFESCELSTTLAIIHMLRRRIVLPDEVVVREGEVGDRMYFVSRGKLSVFQANKKAGVDVHVNEIHAGGYFGELAMFESSSRNATIIAETFCELEELLKTEFDILIADHQDLAEYFLNDKRNKYAKKPKKEAEKKAQMPTTSFKARLRRLSYSQSSPTQSSPTPKHGPDERDLSIAAVDPALKKRSSEADTGGLAKDSPVGAHVVVPEADHFVESADSEDIGITQWKQQQQQRLAAPSRNSVNGGDVDHEDGGHACADDTDSTSLSPTDSPTLDSSNAISTSSKTGSIGGRKGLGPLTAGGDSSKPGRIGGGKGKGLGLPTAGNTSKPELEPEDSKGSEKHNRRVSLKAVAGLTIMSRRLSNSEGVSAGSTRMTDLLALENQQIASKSAVHRAHPK